VPIGFAGFENGQDVSLFLVYGRVPLVVQSEQNEKYCHAHGHCKHGSSNGFCYFFGVS
jgi:hypothetical protein